MSDHVYIVAEAGVNHNGDLRRALSMVDAAALAGCDAVKFQTFRPEALVTRDAPQAAYQMRNAGDCGSQLTMLRGLALGPEAHRSLQARCAERAIEFLSSPFDAASADFLIHELGLTRIKLGSGELTNAPLLLRLARAQRDLVLSTGMATLDEIGDALGVLAFGYLQQGQPTGRCDLPAALGHPRAREVLRKRVTLLHCTSEYPCPFDQANLRAMDSLAEAFGLAVGYSDHTMGIQVSVAAAARGACLLEKHFTLDRSLPGPDHAASLEPDELGALVSAVRVVSKALGSAEKVPAAAERDNLRMARKSLVAAHPIRAGERFSDANLTTKRPGSGRPPLDYWELLGARSPRDYAADEVIE